jgi:predicted DCC family thiol-disulfide oxidoreductase YuxK
LQSATCDSEESDLIESDDWDRHSADRALLIFDGDCGFCRRSAGYAQRLIGPSNLAVGAASVMAQHFDELSDEDLKRSVWLVQSDGRLQQGAQAVFESLAMAPGFGLGRFLYRFLPGFAAVSEIVYRGVARKRHRISSWVDRLWGRPLLPSSYAVSTALFIRVMGLVYLCSFLSLAVQLPGLSGPNGILPIGEFLVAAKQQLGSAAYLSFPTHAWFSASNFSLVFVAGLGAFCGLGLLLGLMPRWLALIAWVLHLSLMVAGRDFLYYQWDILLSEAGFLLVALAPAATRLRRETPLGGRNLARWLCLWLLWRVVWISGYVKLASGDTAWAACSALSVHYQTQPLPNPMAFAMHHLPAWFHQLSCVSMFGIELIAPMLLIAPRRLRHLGALAIIVLMLLIAASGNYGSFNLLTMALALLAFDDRFFARFVPLATFVRPLRASLRARLAAALLALLSLSVTLERNLGPSPLLAPLRAGADVLRPLRIVNSYGLFAVMTMKRPELVIEGSLDGHAWKAYELPYKPGRLDRMPAWAAPHMPRLDWQLWFAALGGASHNRWLGGLLKGLLLDRKEVTGLFAELPFNVAPDQVRVRRFNYRFARWGSPDWWIRDETDLYLKPVTLGRENEIIFAQPTDRMRPDP